MSRIFSLFLILIVPALASPLNGQVPTSDLNDEATLLKERGAFDPDYIKLRRARQPRFIRLAFWTG